MATDKQITANKSNAQQSTGAITDVGKETIKYNALKHGILRAEMSTYENTDIEEIKEELFNDFQPKLKIQGYLLERIAIHLVKLKRINKAEKEIIVSFLHPDFSPINLNNKSYQAKLGADVIRVLSDIYQRYEITEENRMYKALEQFRQLQSTT